MSDPTFTPARPRRLHRRKFLPSLSPAPPTLLTLIAAEYEDGTSLTMSFDRAIDVSAMQVDSIVVRDGVMNDATYSGAGLPLLVSPTSVRVELAQIGGYDVADITLTADAANGIVAVDGGTWDGVSDLNLPYP